MINSINPSFAYTSLKLSFSRITWQDVVVFLAIAGCNGVSFHNLYEQVHHKIGMTSQELLHSLEKLLGNSRVGNAQRFSLITRSTSTLSLYYLSAAYSG